MGWTKTVRVASKWLAGILGMLWGIERVIGLAGLPDDAVRWESLFQGGINVLSPMWSGVLLGRHNSVFCRIRDRQLGSFGLRKRKEKKKAEKAKPETSAAPKAPADYSGCAIAVLFLILAGVLWTCAYRESKKPPAPPRVALQSVTGDRVEVRTRRAKVAREYLDPVARTGCLRSDPDLVPIYTGFVEVFRGKGPYRIVGHVVHSYRCVAPDEAERIKQAETSQ